MIIKKCQCGAVTVELKTRLFFMTGETFKDIFSMDTEKAESEWYACNHCANNWGIDICACGSGESPEECSNDFDCCGTPYQSREELEYLINSI